MIQNTEELNCLDFFSKVKILKTLIQVCLRDAQYFFCPKNIKTLIYYCLKNSDFLS